MKRVKVAGSDVTAIVDDEDYEMVAKYTWRISRRKTVAYAVAFNKGAGGRAAKPRNIYLHRLIAGFPDQVDHINGDGLDCRRLNLRPCTTADNRHNQQKTRGTSIYKGVSYRGDVKMWRATITVNRKTRDIGRFKTEIEAAQAYDRAAHIYFGPFARFNFPGQMARPQPTSPMPSYGAVINNGEIAWPDKTNAVAFLSILLKELGQ